MKLEYIYNFGFQSIMDQEILGGDEEFEVIVDNTPQSPDDQFFNQVVQALQEIVVNEQFQKNQAGFMRAHCQIFESVQENKKEYMPIFTQYQKTMSTCLQKMLTQRVPNFNMSHFAAMLPTRIHQIDEEIYEILISLSDFQVFKELMLDYKQAHQEQERLRVLTIKSNKIPENKKVKGTGDNIFGNSKVPLFGNQPLTKKKPTNASKKQKTEQQILVPDLVLTIRPLRKG